MNYGNIKYFAIEDGIGCRTALFVSGCRHHCEGCFQPETWNFDYGQPFTDETENDIIDSLQNKFIDGLTILGGEPFEPENQECIATLIEHIRDTYPYKTIWIYSGYTFEQLMNENEHCHTENTLRILKNTDILVDGEFIKSQKNLMLAFRGSENQRVLDVAESLKENKPILSKYHTKR